MNYNDIHIVVDERERKSGIPDLLEKMGLNVKIETLKVGDYIIDSEIIVERKTIEDMMASISDGRLYRQCVKLKENFQHPIILLEGSVVGNESFDKNPLIFYDVISTIALNFKISIISTPGATHTAKLLSSMGSKTKSQIPTVKIIKESNNLQKQQLILLSNLPNIGEKMAIRILEHFQTPLIALNSTVDEMSKIEGLGKEKAEKIKNMLNSNNDLYKNFG